MGKNFDCYEIHRANMPQYGCVVQCEACKNRERAEILETVNPPIKERILEETPEETVQKARDYGDSLVNKDLDEAAKEYKLNVIPSVYHAFVAGAKWQAERMLTKTQAIYFAGYLMGKIMQNPSTDVSEIFDEWEKELKPNCKL